jgi:hypothetical protein
VVGLCVWRSLSTSGNQRDSAARLLVARRQPRPWDGGSQSTAARSRIDARRYRGVRLDELRTARSFAPRDRIGIKEKGKGGRRTSGSQRFD